MTDLTATARRCLDQYDVQCDHIEFVRHNENATFYAESGAHRGRMVLRVHQPAIDGIAPEFGTPRAVRSALMWMEALAADSPIAVQKPIRARDGALTAAVATVHCSLVQWLAGEPLDQDHPRAAEHVRAFGGVVAVLHDHAERWQPPQDFWRPGYGRPFLAGIAARLEPGPAAGLFDSRVLALFQHALARIADLAEAAAGAPGQWGLVHADLQGGNILVHDHDIRPIDFTMCGWGPYLFEVGMAASCLQARWRRDFIAAYQQARPLAPTAQAAMEAGALQGILAAYSYHVANPRSHGWIKRRAKLVADQYCGAFLDGRSFLFDM